MSAASCVLSEDQFLCCICLDVFTDPVTIPCGHNFCKLCITQHWNVNHVQYHCPMCKKQFKVRPELSINTFISQMAAEFRQSAAKKQRRDPEITVAKPGEICCDVCTGTKLKATKSCLTCLASYCGIHIDPHMTAASLKRHQLTDPVENLESRVCSKHKKPLELFCKTDQTCVCCHCSVSAHAGHIISCLKEEFEAKKSQLQREDADIQLMIQERRLKLRQIQRLKMDNKADAERAVSDGVKVFTLLSQTAETGLNDLIETIEETQRTAEREADGVITELEQEISALTKKTDEVRQLSCTQDHLHLLQNFRSMTSKISTRNWSEVRVCPPSYDGTVERAVTELEQALCGAKQQLLHKFRLKRVQLFAVDVVLDPQTANPWLVLSDDNKQVWCGEASRKLPDNPDRFSVYVSVVAQQSFSSGRFYYEVQVTGKTDWTVGVVKKSVNRKVTCPVSPVHGYWSVGLRGGKEFLTLSSPVVSLSLDSRPQKVGVFVSFEEGLVSFYDVEAELHLYSFTNCIFTEELCPFFSPGLRHGELNSDPLIISPVSTTD